MRGQILFDIDAAAQKAADEQIRVRQQEVKYDLRDFTIGYLVQQFREDVFYIPPYQREHIWRPKHQCRFIESVVLGLPIPMMFVAEMEDGRWEIVDGAQRIQTLELFLDDKLRLSELQRLPALDGFTFSDLSVAQQRKFEAKPLRIVVLDSQTTAEARQEIFDRVNTSGVKARPSEVRKGALAGPFMSFIAACAADPTFVRLCPLSEMSRSRREGEELVLRFFAYSDRYLEFRHDVDHFLEAYAREHQQNFDQARMSHEFSRMLDFVDKHFPYGFAKNHQSRATPRVRFEAISVGVNLALRLRADFKPQRIREWLESEEFKSHVTTHASNSLP